MDGHHYADDGATILHWMEVSAVCTGLPPRTRLPVVAVIFVVVAKRALHALPAVLLCSFRTLLDTTALLEAIAEDFWIGVAFCAKRSTQHYDGGQS